MSRLSTKSIALASDHAGFILKEKILFYLKKLKIKTFDLGTFSEDRVDYPDNAKKACIVLEKKEVFNGNTYLWFWNWRFYRR